MPSQLSSQITGQGESGGEPQGSQDCIIQADREGNIQMIEQKEHDFHRKNELVKLILHKKPQKASSLQLTN